MDFNEYQTRTATTAKYPGQGSTLGLLYVGLGLGEQGEVQGKIKKVLRDDIGHLFEPDNENVRCEPHMVRDVMLHENVLSDERRSQIKAELGDVLWYAAQLATEIGVDLGDVAEANLQKLADRMERGVIQGSGDDR